MNKQHLQIGNLVSLNGQPVQVRTLTRHKVGVLTSNKHTQLSYVHLREIEPIPITKEFLRKNGFIHIVDKLDGYITSYDKEIDGNFLEIRFGISNTSNDHVVCHVDNSDRCSIGCADIQYVHQLQNFLSVLNIKMKVEL